VHHAIGQGADAVAVGYRYPHQLGDHVHRQLAGEFRDVVDGLAGRRLIQHGVEVLHREFGDPPLELPDPARREAFGHQRAQPQMRGIVHREKRHGLRSVRSARHRVQRDAVAVGQCGAVAETLQHVAMTRKRPEAELLVVVQRRLVP
jgi:hypothetical protein